MKRTKSVILTLLLITSTLFNSCNSDDDNAQEESIIGTFLSISTTFEEFDDDGVSEGEDLETSDENNFFRLIFNADNTFSSTFSEERDRETFTNNLTGTYIVNGNILSTTVEDEDTNVSNFTLNGDTLTIVFEGEDGGRFIETMILERQ